LAIGGASSFPTSSRRNRPIAVVLLIGAICADLQQQSGSKCCSTTGTGASTDSIQNKNEEVFWREIKYFSVVAGIWIAVYIARAIVSPYLRTALAALAYPAIPLALARRPRLLPHRTAAQRRQRRPAHRRGSAPARRIHHALLLGFLGAVATLISFIFILWSSRARCRCASSASTSRSRLHGLGRAALRHRRHLPRQLVGRRLIPSTSMKQRYEANFRFSLVRVRENAEGIALYNGEQREADCSTAASPTSSPTAGACCSPRRSSPSISGLRPARDHLPYLVTAPRFLRRRDHASAS
jgi:putative ATP-binding cassette transporter